MADYLASVPRVDRLHLIPAPALRPGLTPSAYDTAWLASLRLRYRWREPRFPDTVRWLLDHQHPDGSWGGTVRYEHDRVICTLAALVALSLNAGGSGCRQRIDAGTHYLWNHSQRLSTEPVELVAFELLLPALIDRARKAGVAVPAHLDIYQAERAEKLRLLPAGALYSPALSTVHSLEFLGEQASIARLRQALGANGSLGDSPAATAYLLTRTHEPKALDYLRGCLQRHGGDSVPAAFPSETLELLWTAYSLWLGGVRAAFLLRPEERTSLREALQRGGVSWSSSFAVPDADDTAIALVLLHDAGVPVTARVLEAFATPDGHFASFAYERRSSVGVNVHVLHALLRVPGYPNRDRAIERLLDYVAGQQRQGAYWLDKWHISPYYATAHALLVLRELPPALAAKAVPLVQGALAWLRETQHPDGSWGYYDQPTAEETAYAVLALGSCVSGRAEPSDVYRCAAGLRYIERSRQFAGNEDDTAQRDASHRARLEIRHPYPPLWVEKCLYAPTLVVEAVIRAAQRAVARWRRRERATHGVPQWDAREERALRFA